MTEQHGQDLPVSVPTFCLPPEPCPPAPEKVNNTSLLESLSPISIPQLDGPVPELSNLVTTHDNILTNTSTRTANFIFNQDKQTEKIKNDAKINDYEVNVNNGDQNATVKCSSGFYLQVARASLGSLHDKSVLSAGNIAITVDKTTVTNDQRGTEATKLLSFSLLSDQRKVGGVSVHLHHSTRTIQIQGSSIMPDSSRAALWFLKNFVLLRFKEQAKAKHFVIKNTNESILKASNFLPSKSRNHCSLCNREFNASSKPSECSSCKTFFHKTNCLREHMKNAHSNTETVPVSSTLLSSPAITTITDSIAIPSSSLITLSQPTGGSTQCSQVPINTPPPASSSLSPITSVASVGNHSSTISISTVLTSLQPPTTCSSLLSSSLPSSSSSSKPSSKPPKKQKSFVPVTAEQARIEFLQAELAAAQTRIVQLDANVKEKDQRVTILQARLKIFEDEQAKTIHDKYFDSSGYQRKPQAVPQYHPCLHQLPSCCHAGHQHHCQTFKNPEENNSPLMSSISKLEEKLDTLATETKSMQLALLNIQARSSLSEPPHPPSPTDRNCGSTVTANVASAQKAVQNDDADDPPISLNDESVTSIEEFIFNVDDQPLNCHQLTSQH